MTKPIAPDEIGKAKASRIPAAVFEAFNETIAKHWDGRAATFTQQEVVAAILGKMPEATRTHLYESHWLDVEDSYRASGWQVVYDKPGYCETYAPSFTFKKRRTR